MEADAHTGAGYHYYASFPFFAKATSDASERLKGLLAGLFREAEIAEGDFSLQDIHNSLVPCLDNLLDRVDEALQEKDKPGREKRQKGVPFHAKSIARPQDSFATPVDNSNSPWIPPPPLGSEGQETEPGKHPLEQRIRDMEAPKQVLEIPQILREMPAPMDRTEGAFIDTTEALNSLAKDLRNQKEIAVDLEANQYRSFQGITCLMQISTRFQDYVVDAIALRSQLRHFLAPIFEDPSIIKVLHGADSDVTWLQRCVAALLFCLGPYIHCFVGNRIVVFNPHWSREGNQNERRDFGMYLIGLFDTGQAARVLEMEKYSLAHVLEVRIHSRVPMLFMQFFSFAFHPLWLLLSFSLSFFLVAFVPTALLRSQAGQAISASRLAHKAIDRRYVALRPARHPLLALHLRSSPAGPC